MADVVYSKIVELLDNSQYIDALKKAEQEEKVLAGLRELGGKAAVKAYRDIDREQKRATAGQSAFTAALESTAKSSASTAAGMQQLSFQLNDVVTQLAAGSNPMQVLAQQGGQIVQAFQTAPGLLASVVDKVTALGPALAVTGAALSPLIFLWKDYTDAKNAATDADKRWQAVAKDGDNVIKDAAARVRELNMELAPLTDQQRELERTSQRWKDATAAGTAEIDKEIAATEKAIAAMAKTAPELAAQTELLEKLRARKAAVTKAGQDGFEAERKLAQARRDAADQDRQLEQAEKDIEERRKKGAEAAKKRAEAEAALDETARIAAENMGNMAKEREEKERAALAALVKRTEHIDDLIRSERGLSAAEAQEERDALARAFNTAEAWADTAAERVAIAKRTQEAIAEIGQMEILENKKIEAAKRKEDEETARKQQRDLQSGLNAMVDAYASAASAIADATEEKGSKAAMAAFRTSQALGYGQALIAALKTGGEVAAQLAPVLGPAAIPAGVTAGIAAGAAFAVPISQMEPPSFTDTPGPVRMGAARGTTASFAAGDTVVAARTPDDMLKQVLAAVRERPGPVPTVPSSRRRLLGPSLARDPVARSLTSDLWRVTRGALPPG